MVYFPHFSSNWRKITNVRIRTFGSNIILLTILIWFAFLIGCSGGDIEPITSPSQNGATDTTKSAGDAAQRQLWGYYSGYADTETGRFELAPMRTVELHVNLVSVLNASNGVQAKVIWSKSQPSQGLFEVRVTLNHPYASDPKYTGFDVRGILITGASQSIGLGLWTAGDAHPRLLNADGFTRWWNPFEFLNPGLFGYTNGKLGNPYPSTFDAQLNGYKIFADALPEQEENPVFLTGPGIGDDNGRAVFRSADISRRYRIKFPQGISYFNYAVDASWAPPVINPPTVPDDFPPDANCPEAFYIKCEPVNNLEYIPATGEHKGNLTLDVQVYDWQGRMAGTIAPQVIFVNIHSTGLFGTSVAQGTLTSDDGLKAVYHVDLTPLCNPDNVGTYWLGVEVVSSQGAYKQSWQASPSAALAAYQLFSIQVTEGVVEPELLKKFGIHAWVLRKSDGTSPPITDAEIDQHIAYANAFWNEYGFGFVLSERTYINNSTYYNIDAYNSGGLYQYKHDTTGLINLYYVNSVIGEDASFCIIYCEYEKNYAKSTYIVYDCSSDTGWDEVLTHELGHNIGMLEDLYWLNYGYSCSDIEYTFCGYYPTGVYCSPGDAVDGNIMYGISEWPGTPPSMYFISDNDMDMITPQINSQGENAAYFHTYYPNLFKNIQ